MSTRGCPFSCEFCSNVMFGSSCRARSAENVVAEVEDALSFGYDRIHFADDVFTLDKARVVRICEEIERRKLHFEWECLGRVDSVDAVLLRRMKKAGCDRIFFGIESGNDDVLALMNKRITVEKAERAVRDAHTAGLHTGAFFILYYPGETDDTVRATLRFALSLPLDYLSFTMPYPIPGTGLFRRVMGGEVREWKQPDALLFDHTLTFDADFSEAKMRFAILKGQISSRSRHAREGGNSRNEAVRKADGSRVEDHALRRVRADDGHAARRPVVSPSMKPVAEGPPGDLSARIARMWELSAAKIRSTERSYDPSKGSPVFTVSGAWTSRGWTEWTQGFQYGSAMLQFDATGEKEFLEIGRAGTPGAHGAAPHPHGRPRPRLQQRQHVRGLLRLMNEGRIPENRTGRGPSTSSRSR